MNKKVKALLLVLCALILVVGSVMGTLAYLTSKTDPITNTFTVGSVSISMVESETDEYGTPTGETTDDGNKYKLIPGHTYTKNPTITVADKSEPCYLFVKVENGIADYEASDNTIAYQLAANGWTEVDGADNVYSHEVVDARNGAVDVPVFGTFKLATNADTIDANDDDVADWASISANTVVVTAYAIQFDGLADASAAWAALAGQLNLP